MTRLSLRTQVLRHIVLQCAAFYAEGWVHLHTLRTCPRRTISDLRSFFIAQIFPVARSRHIRTCVRRVCLTSTACIIC